MTDQPYCTGDRCEDCTPDDKCCEATCGCCPRVGEHGHCFLYPGSEEDSQYCDQHGEGSLYERSPNADDVLDRLTADNDRMLTKLEEA